MEVLFPMINFSAVTKQGVALLLLLAVLSGCTDQDEPTHSQSSLEVSSATPVQSSMPSLKYVEKTYDEVRQSISIDMTPYEVKNIFGSAYEIESTSLYWNSDWIPSEMWTYSNDAASSRLQLYWSQDKRLLYAIFFDKDAKGNKRNYIPALGALVASSSEDNLRATKYGIRLGQTIQVPAIALGYDLISSSKPIFSYIAVPQRKVTITALAEAFAEVDDDGIRAWIPTWYLTKEAAYIQDIEPLELTIKQDGHAVWHPRIGLRSRGN